MTQFISEESDQDVREAIAHNRPSRAELVLALIDRDGDECRYCHRDFKQRERTIDHVYPQSRGYTDGWTYEQVWDLSNLVLACKPCNAKKGDQLLNEDGTIPARKARTFRYRRDKRATRPDAPCVVCDNGHNLFIDEICAQCGVSAQQFPRSAKVKSPDCDHALTWCWACSIGIVERKGSLEMLFFGVEGQEDGFIE
jgi:5-methylcytosine-specific restriction endonuclease McrA